MNHEPIPIVIAANPVFGKGGLASTVELAKEMSGSVSVLFINNPLTLTDALKAEHRSRVKAAVKNLLYTPKEHQNIRVLEPPIMLPINALSPGRLYNFLRRINVNRYERKLRKAMHILNWEKVDVINAFNPHYQGFERREYVRKSIYYCYDNIKAAKYLAKHGGYLEKELVQRVDAIIVSSQGLMQKFQGIDVAKYWVPNGMSPENFKLIDSLEKEQIQMVYIGAMDDRLDYDLIASILQHERQPKLTLVGPLLVKEAELLSKRQNVHYLGSYAPEDVGKHITHCNVGLIPFISNEFTKYIYPLKINEYLSMGMAVLTTDFAPLEEFDAFVRPVHDSQTAHKEVSRIIAEDLTDELAKQRSAFAQKNSWNARAKQMLEIIHG